MVVKQPWNSARVGVPSQDGPWLSLVGSQRDQAVLGCPPGSVSAFCSLAQALSYRVFPSLPFLPTQTSLPLPALCEQNKVPLCMLTCPVSVLRHHVTLRVRATENSRQRFYSRSEGACAHSAEERYTARLCHHLGEAQPCPP